MEATEGKRTRPWWMTKRMLWGVLFILGGLACIGHSIIVPASKHDEQHTECQQGPCTVDNAPWAWALGGGVLLVTGLGSIAWARFQYTQLDNDTSQEDVPR